MTFPTKPKPFDTLTTYTQLDVQQFRARPMDVRLAVRALCEIDILCEHIALSDPDVNTPGEVAAAKEKLFRAEPALRTAKDVHDTHKHGPLHRNSATIKSGIPAQVQRIGGSGLLGFGALGEGPLGSVPTASLMIVTETNSFSAFRLMETAFAFLIAEMERRNLFPK
jgi:hypothetical protein